MGERTRRPLQLQVPAMARESSFNIGESDGGQCYSFQDTDPNSGTSKIVTIPQQGDQGFRLSQFVLGPELGRGEGGGVRIATHIPTEKQFALKEISIGSKGHREQLMKELQTHRGCGRMHDIVELYDVFYEEGRVYLVLELMDWGSLQVLLQQQAERRARMDERVLSVILNKITRALHFLHDQHRLIHRDLKPANVVMGTQGVVKLSDFGVSRVLDQDAKGVTWVGTVGYMSPERLQGNQYSMKADIWSVGIIAIECALGHHPYMRSDGQESPLFEIMQRVVNEDVPIPQGSGLSAQLEDFIKCCLQKDEEQRWSAEQLLQHPFLKEPNLAAEEQDGIMRWWLGQYSRPKFYDDYGNEFIIGAHKGAGGDMMMEES